MIIFFIFFLQFFIYNNQKYQIYLLWVQQSCNLKMMKAISMKFPVNTVIHTIPLNWFFLFKGYVDVVSAENCMVKASRRALSRIFFLKT